MSSTQGPPHRQLPKPPGTQTPQHRELPAAPGRLPPRPPKEPIDPLLSQLPPPPSHLPSSSFPVPSSLPLPSPPVHQPSLAFPPVPSDPFLSLPTVPSSLPAVTPHHHVTSLPTSSFAPPPRPPLSSKPSTDFLPPRPPPPNTHSHNTLPPLPPAEPQIPPNFLPPLPQRPCSEKPPLSSTTPAPSPYVPPGMELPPRPPKNLDGSGGGPKPKLTASGAALLLNPETETKYKKIKVGQYFIYPSVLTPMSPSPLALLTNHPQVIMEIGPCSVFALIQGNPQDATKTISLLNARVDGSAAPQSVPKPEKVPKEERCITKHQYFLQFIVPERSERSNENTHFAVLRMTRLHIPQHQSSFSLTPVFDPLWVSHSTAYLNDPNIVEIKMLRHLPVLRVRPFTYAVRSADNPFLLCLPEDTPSSIIDELEILFQEFGRIQRLQGETVTDSAFDKTGAVLNAGGNLVGRGIVGGATLLGRGMRVGTRFLTSSSSKPQLERGASSSSGNSPPQLKSSASSSSHVGSSEGSEEEKKDTSLDNVDKGATLFLKGARGVKTGLAKGFGFVGKTGMAVADTTKNTVTRTDWYQEREKKKQEEKIEKQCSMDYDDLVAAEQEKALKNAAKGTFGVAKSGLNAGFSVISGVKQAVRCVGADIRDNTVLISQHSHGDEGAAQTKQTLDIAAKLGLGGLFCAQLYSTTTLKCALYVGKGALAYDPDKKDLLMGLVWHIGWLTKQGSLMNPWSPRFAILRSYSIAFYHQPPDPDSFESAHNPSSYIALDSIRAVKAERQSECKERWAFSVQTKNDLYYFSLDCSQKVEGWEEKSDNDMHVETYLWIHYLQSLAYLNSLSEHILVPIDNK